RERLPEEEGAGLERRRIEDLGKAVRALPLQRLDRVEEEEKDDPQRDLVRDPGRGDAGCQENRRVEGADREERVPERLHENERDENVESRLAEQEADFDGCRSPGAAEERGNGARHSERADRGLRTHPGGGV